MALTINSNASSLNTQRALTRSSKTLETVLERLASGRRINRAKDDAAGLAISESLRAQREVTTVAIRNTNDGISKLNIAEGALETGSDIVIRMRELATISANGTVSDEQRVTLNQEFLQLRQELDRISVVTKFNDEKVLGSTTTPQTGTESGPEGQTSVAIADVNSSSLSIDTLDISTQAGASAALQPTSDAISSLAASRGEIGAVQSRLTTNISNLSSLSENLASANSRIVDADFATEAANLAAASILKQAGVAVLAQANSQPSLALQLLRG